MVLRASAARLRGCLELLVVAAYAQEVELATSVVDPREARACERLLHADEELGRIPHIGLLEKVRVANFEVVRLHLSIFVLDLNDEVIDVNAARTLRALHEEEQVRRVVMLNNL